MNQGVRAKGASVQEGVHGTQTAVRNGGILESGKETSRCERCLGSIAERGPKW